MDPWQQADFRIGRQYQQILDQIAKPSVELQLRQRLEISIVPMGRAPHFVPRHRLGKGNKLSVPELLHVSEPAVLPLIIRLGSI